MRLLLTLMLALGAIPASAMPCHDAMPAMASMAMPAPADRVTPATPAPDRGVAAHFCIGCVPPSAMLGNRVAGPVFHPAPAPIARVAQFLPGAGDPPSPPPPRRV